MKLSKILAIVILGSFLGGCNLLELPAYWIFGQTYNTVKAEHTDLEGKNTAIIIALGPSVYYDDPDTRLNLALAVASMVKKNVKDVTFVEQSKIENYQSRHLDWVSMSISELGTLFKAQRVLYIDLYEYAMYAPNSVNLLQAQLNASLYIYDMESEQKNKAVYSSEIKSQYPQDHPKPFSKKALQEVRFNSVTNFADSVAKKFYDHELEL